MKVALKKKGGILIKGTDIELTGLLDQIQQAIDTGESKCFIINSDGVIDLKVKLDGC